MISCCIVTISDFVTARRTRSVIEQDDFAIVDRMWGRRDSLLRDLQENPYFSGRQRWCDLDVSHFRIMITQNLVSVSSVPDDELMDINNGVIHSLHFLIACMIRRIQENTFCDVESLRINRTSVHEVTFDFTASLVNSFKPETSISNDFNLTVVVSNE